MGEFVRQHGFDLGVVECIEKAARDGDGILAGVEAGRVGVENGAIQDLQARHRKAARDAQVFEQIVEPGFFVTGERASIP